MMQLVSRNVSLKPAHRKQIHAWLRRSQRLANQIGDAVMTITIQRLGKRYEVQGQVQDSVGSFTCRSSGDELMHACRKVARSMTARVHSDRVQFAA